MEIEVNGLDTENDVIVKLLMGSFALGYTFYLKMT